MTKILQTFHKFSKLLDCCASDRVNSKVRDANSRPSSRHCAAQHLPHDIAPVSCVCLTRGQARSCFDLMSGQGGEINHPQPSLAGGVVLAGVPRRILLRCGEVSSRLGIRLVPSAPATPTSIFSQQPPSAEPSGGSSGCEKAHCRHPRTDAGTISREDGLDAIWSKLFGSRECGWTEKDVGTISGGESPLRIFSEFNVFLEGEHRTMCNGTRRTLGMFHFCMPPRHLRDFLWQPSPQVRGRAPKPIVNHVQWATVALCWVEAATGILGVGLEISRPRGPMCATLWRRCLH